MIERKNFSTFLPQVTKPVTALTKTLVHNGAYLLKEYKHFTKPIESHKSFFFINLPCTLLGGYTTSLYPLSELNVIIGFAQRIASTSLVNQPPIKKFKKSYLICTFKHIIHGLFQQKDVLLQLTISFLLNSLNIFCNSLLKIVGT